jgi:iron complex outermembrane recepter protein
MKSPHLSPRRFGGGLPARAERQTGVPLVRRPLALLVALAVSTGAAAAPSQDPTLLSLEELMGIEISSAAKRPQRLSDAATAIHAIGREEIRRSGATNLPELLRTVPGVQVSRIDGSRYAVSIRGFSSRYSGKLLILQDGRTLYSPLFSGTYWEAQDVLLEDVERIEVIRGSGGTLWGANAVNGVINIITRQAKDTQGTYVGIKGGSLENGVALRHGAALDNGAYARAYAKIDRHDGMDTASGSAAHDAWRQERAGFRIDMAPSASDKVTVQGDVFEARSQQSVLVMPGPMAPPAFVPDTARSTGINLLARWQHETSAKESWHLQAFADQTKQADVMQAHRIDTVDLEWQHRLPLTSSQDLTWGLGLRSVDQQLDGGYTVSMNPSKLGQMLYSGFVQDEIQLHEDVHLTLGTKLEHNAFTGLETQPSARLQWRATPTDNVWVAASRAVATPSLASTSAVAHVGLQPVPSLGNAVLGVRGNPNLQSEVVKSFELGYRGQFGPSVTLDAAGFYNQYDKLVSREYRSLSFTPYPLIPLVFDNAMEGKTYGTEWSANWQISPDWRLHGSYSWLKMDLRAKAGGSGIVGFGAAGSSPQHMVQLHSLHKLGHDLELDANVYYTSQLSFAKQFGTTSVPGFTRLDLRLGWRPSRDVEVNLIGRNLLQKRHQEYLADDVTATQIPRSLLVQFKWKF